jgi:hypothetical protein
MAHVSLDPLSKGTTQRHHRWSFRRRPIYAQRMAQAMASSKLARRGSLQSNYPIYPSPQTKNGSTKIKFEVTSLWRKKEALLNGDGLIGALFRFIYHPLIPLSPRS